VYWGGGKGEAEDRLQCKQYKVKKSILVTPMAITILNIKLGKGYS
jgi:hypothetical protein